MKWLEKKLPWAEPKDIWTNLLFLCLAAMLTLITYTPGGNYYGHAMSITLVGFVAFRLWVDYHFWKKRQKAEAKLNDL
jgi:hypothetical protein